MTYHLVLKNGTVMTPWGAVTCDLAINHGKIAGLGHFNDADKIIDIHHHHVLPGIIDSQVHFREPGMEHKEDLESGTRSAILGGVTSIFEMPNTNPLTTTPERLADKVQRATGRTWCDFAFFMGGTAENAAKLGEYERLPACSGIKVFMGSSTGDLLVANDEPLAQILRNINRRMSIHAEDEAMLIANQHLRGDDVQNHPVWRSVDAAVSATKRILSLAKQYQKKVHILHISTADEIPLLRVAKNFATMEVTPHHLTLSAPQCYERLGTLAQMNPPVRDQSHQDALWQAINDGTVDVLGSDHAPHTLDEKAKPYPQSPSGMTGVQTLLPIMLNHVHEKRLSLERLVDLTAHAQQRLFQIMGKGRIAPGWDADLVVVDLKKQWRIEKSWLASKAGWSPYENKTITGYPAMTILSGEIAVRDGETIGNAKGKPVRFL